MNYTDGTKGIRLEVAQRKFLGIIPMGGVFPAGSYKAKFNDSEQEIEINTKKDFKLLDINLNKVATK